MYNQFALNTATLRYLRHQLIVCQSQLPFRTFVKLPYALPKHALV